MIDKILKDYNVILASASPRRKEIFSLIGITCEVVVSDVAEPITDEDPALQSMRHARNKHNEVAAGCDENDIVVSADTIVVLDGAILGKPRDTREAISYLQRLSGNTHTVITGICVGTLQNHRCAYESTQVVFSKLCSSEIEHYVATGEPMDKAGAYGIQGFGSQFIRSIEGCCFNVMGFPIRRFYDTLLAMKQEDII